MSASPATLPVATPADAAGNAAAASLTRGQINARPDATRFVMLLVQLLMLCAIVYTLKLGQQTHDTGSLFALMIITVAGFGVHYWTRLGHKQTVFLTISIVGGLLLLAAPWSSDDTRPAEVWTQFSNAIQTLAVVLGIAGLAFAWLNCKAGVRVRVLGICVFAAVLAYGRHYGLWLDQPGHWWVIGSLFMLRGILYVLEIKNTKKPEGFLDSISYFLLLPNFYFMLFPVVDYQTFKKSFYARDIHETAQRGIFWITRGLIQLSVDRIVYHKLTIAPQEVNSLLEAVQFLIVPYLLYIRITGQFHIAVGMLLLFGYDLPKTSHRYMLASSFTEFWRRANVYWKDFMVNAFYYSAYLKLRRWNDRLAAPLAIGWVFLVTMLLHSYQYFWLQGRFQLTVRDLLFWTLLGVLVAVTSLRQQGRTRQAKGRSIRGIMQHGLAIAGVFLTISVVWSMWTSPSLADWADTVIYWK